jgi:hypothetical protein
MNETREYIGAFVVADDGFLLEDTSFESNLDTLKKRFLGKNGTWFLYVNKLISSHSSNARFILEVLHEEIIDINMLLFKDSEEIEINDYGLTLRRPNSICNKDSYKKEQHRGIYRFPGGVSYDFYPWYVNRTKLEEAKLADKLVAIRLRFYSR